MVNELIPIRLSHLLSYSGVGAIVRGASGLVVVQDTRQWTDRQGVSAGKRIPYVERVRAALGLEEQLREPPVAKKLAKGQVDGTCVPATRFPSWIRCASCGSMYRWLWKDYQADDEPACRYQGCKRNPKLEQVTWVLVHPKGYLSDVPWHYLAHKDARDPSQRNCKVKNQLQLIERGYEDRILQCRACGTGTRFRGDERLNFGQGRMQPWTKDDSVPPIEQGQEGEQVLAQVLTINDTRVYAPIAESVLVIPPESRVRKGTVVDRLYRNSGDRSRIDEARTPLARKSAMNKLATAYRCSIEDIETALADLASGYPLYGENLTPGQLRENEFKAFLEVLPDQREDEDLVTYHKSEEWRHLGMSFELSTDEQEIVKSVRHLVRVDRLKAVKVFKGFTRLGGEETIPPDIVGTSDWLPAVELYGEGIFLALDESRLKVWEQTPAVVSRLNQLLPRFSESGRDAPNPLTTRFMLLHTLSHLLIRQIEFEGGYPAASLIERIYCANAPEPMAGILIHVAVPDIAGSLGGLAELSEPRRFLGILNRALEHSRWCSLDPVCSEHEGQGPGLLNRAACHGCALVPEPACEYGNTLLDRGFVKGDAANGLPSFFGIS
ncbi:MAG: hypothetical protein CSA50_05265 [Gammaproteobacteria bacterium]|nr:MAG: hypothetical protein CSA50_05265 [Gammaproteobacteria bacterium]